LKIPLVSVIIPCFNHGKYLRQRIESVINQTVSDIEVFLLDDCSTDNSWEIMQEYRSNSKVVNLHRNENNSGSPFIQWQNGIDIAKGKYIWLAESDDFAALNFLEKHIEVLENNSEIGLSFSPSNWIDTQNNIIDEPNHEAKSFLRNGNDLIVNDFTKGCLIYNASSAVFRKDLIESIDFQVINSYKFTGDWLFWVQLIGSTKVNRTSERLNYFRRHTENVSTKSNKLGLQFSEGFKVVKYIFANHKLTFFQKRKIYMNWASKVKQNTSIEAKKALNLLPNEVRFWYNLLPILKFLQNKIN
jgi:glycosyltransferase involved in cell wall biosynthesis